MTGMAEGELTVNVQGNAGTAFVQVSLFCVYVIQGFVLKNNPSTLMCLSIGTPKNNKFSICSKMENLLF